MQRAELVGGLVALILSMRPGRVLRVAVDGPDAAGKSTLVAELGQRLSVTRNTIQASVDGFHQPRAVRRRRGELSPEGYYHDSFDHVALRDSLLDPLGPGGNRHYRTASYDHRADTATERQFQVAPDDAVLLVDGVFLLRPELREHWDLSIYLEVAPAESIRRALVRDVELFGAVEAVRERYLARYLPGQQLYRDEAAPTRRADVVVDNNDPSAPRVLKWP